MCFVLQFIYGQGYRNGYPFPEDENIVLGETDPLLEDWDCAWSNRYLFAEAANLPRRNGYVMEVGTDQEKDMRRTQIAVSPCQ